MRYLGKVTYLGTKYQGWQKQNDVPSIQGKLEEVLSTLFNSKIEIFGSGRTDAGVHATGQYFTFDAVDRYECNDLVYRVNCLLPEDIKILEFKKVSDDFHARFSAKGKVYKYIIKNEEKDPFLFDRVCLYKEPIDIKLLEEACKMFEGTHDFKDFTSKEEDEDNFVRTIFSVSLEKIDENITLTFEGNGFRYEQLF